MDSLTKKLVGQFVQSSEEDKPRRRASAETLARGVLAEMRNTSNPELALKLAKDALAENVSAYSDDEPDEEGWFQSKKAQLIRKWARISGSIEASLSDDDIQSVVMELAATSEFPTSEDWNKYSSEDVQGFLIDAPNETTEIVDRGALEPRPHDGWDLGDEDSMEPRMPKNKRYHK